jgi:hypothetical protein
MHLRSRTSLVLLATAARIAGVVTIAQADDSPGPAKPPVPPLQLLKQAPGGAAQNSYVAITPCTVAKQAYKKDVVRTIAVSGSTGFSAQGGAAGGCGIPASATAISAILSSSATSAAGGVRTWPSATASQPDAPMLTYVKNRKATATAILNLTPDVAQSLKISNHGPKTTIALTATGYWAPPMHGMVAPASSTDATHNAPIFAGSSRIVSATNPSAGIYVVTFDSNITYCTPMVDTYNAGAGIYGAAYAFSGNTATVFTWYLNSTTHQETLLSYYFYISVVC